MGWAIEGALGSDKKIDATYISPHVNMAELLESSTKEYEVPLLMSEPFFKNLSPGAQKFCRQVNRVQITRNEEPMGLYTYDCDVNQDFTSPEQITVEHNEPFTLTPSLEQSILRREAHRRICKQIISSPQKRRNRAEHYDRKTKSLIEKPEKRDSSKVVLPKRISLDTKVRCSSFLRLNGRGEYEQLEEQCSTPKTQSPQKEWKPSFSLSRVFRPSVMKGGRQRRIQPCNAEIVRPTEISAEELRRKASLFTTSHRSSQQVISSDYVPSIVIPKYTRSVWLTDTDLKRLRVNICDSFRSEWAYAFDLFVKGSWKEALSVFQQLQQHDPGLVLPARKILSLMEDSGGVAPKDWPGWCRLYSHETAEDSNVVVCVEE